MSINYRLGFLGAMASPEARATGGDFGLQDQIAALRWVKRNIGAFGGDPARVTISGQSAGAFSVHYLILSQQARGLFSRAILQSGVGLGVHLDLALAPRDVAERSAGAFLAAAGVKTLDEARKLSLDELSTAFAKVGGRPGSTDGARIGPYADGVVLPLDPAAAFRAGRYNDTPVMIGLTADEGSGLNPHYRSTDAALYKAFLARRFGALAPAVEEFYPAKEGESALPALTRDCGLAMMADWTRTREKTTRFPAFAYMWTHVEPGPESARYGAFHTSEVPYAFGTLDKAPDRPIAAVDWRLADMMQGYWVNFVKSGNPNGKGLPKWLPFGRDNHVEELGDRVGVYPRLDPAKNALLLKHAEGGGNLLAF
ncbi:hypothetical protein L284_09110 [Novosphingobium lindaniclasticum LE124]|uniref:Carboxylic ester hydrolase n=1 Tax=Novosphingobium lindaniclasticum LE124 TaxID=1096930 RepID=T0HXN9_9SPHN|nr:hypothetical protein L284_09110 [Novosphingobium lindaniclasticum LE124]